ncbi:MAG: putative cation exchanger YfkE [Planctomycetota bacterium]
MPMVSHLFKTGIILFAILLTQFDFIPMINFIISLIAIFILADQLKLATESLSKRLGDNVGGLLMAFMGNLPEILISLMALSKGLINVVKASISGAIIGNLLFGLGLAIIYGGARAQILTFNRHVVRVQSAMVIMASCGLLIPALFHISNEVEVEHLSLEISLVLITIYCLSLLFTFVTHEKLLSIKKTAGSEVVPENVEEASFSVISTLLSPLARELERKDIPVKLWSSVIKLSLSAIALGIVSEVLTDALIPISKQFGLTDVFMGVILLSLAGNIGEYLNAISFAGRGKLDLTMQATMGSATQIALLVAPVLVFSSHFMSKPMNLNFSLYEVAAVLMAATVVRSFTYDGETHWLEGCMLIGVYLMLGLGFYHLSV